MNSMTDQDLWEYLKAGNCSALDMLYERHNGHLVTFLKKWKVDQAEDIAQEAWFELYRKSTSELGNRPFKIGLVFTIAYRIGAKYYRQAKRENVQSFPVDHDGNQFIPEHENHDSQAEATRKESANTIQVAISQLTEDERPVIHLFYFEGMKTAEIADVLKIPEGTVKSRLQSARKKLCVSLNEELVLDL